MICHITKACTQFKRVQDDSSCDNDYNCSFNFVILYSVIFAFSQTLG